MTARKELVAAASRYTSRKLRGKGSGDQGWQRRAWDMYHVVPEVRYAASWIGNAMSGARLYAGRRADDGSIEPAPDNHRAAEIVAQIAGGPDGQASLLNAFGKHLTVPGEGWVVVRPNEEALNPLAPEDGHDWTVVSVSEVRRQSGKLTAEIDGEDVEIPEGDPDTMDPNAPVALRVWESDPERAIEADSPVRSSMEVLEELLLLNAAVKAIARSRITGRGLLLIPKGTRFPTTSTQGGAEDDLIELLMTVAETAIRDPDSAAATVPIILELPAEAIAAFQHIKFESEFDELALKLRDEAIRRFAIGLEIPAEILLGLGDVSHWGLWGLTAEAIRLGIEPKLRTVCLAFTQQWLRPILEAEGVEDWHRWLVWYDTSPLRVRTNRAETALQVYDRKAISAQALRRETGFDDADAPEEAEVQERDAETPADDPAPAPDPDLPVDETEAEPDTLPASAAAPRIGEGLIEAADGLIWAALTTAGKRLVNSPAVPRSQRARWTGTDPARLYTQLPVDADQIRARKLLEGVWGRVPEIADRYGIPHECLTASLDDYVQGLLVAGVEHEFAIIPNVLGPCALAVAA